jgi:hypothetical protein
MCGVFRAVDRPTPQGPALYKTRRTFSGVAKTKISRGAFSKTVFLAEAAFFRFS